MGEGPDLQAARASINWDCVLQTAVSDDEIEMVARKDKLYYLKLPRSTATRRVAR